MLRLVLLFGIMDIYDSRYFSINKRLLTAYGLWPYDRPYRKIVTTLALVLLPILNIPHLCGLVIHFDNLEAVFEILCVQVYSVGAWFKLLTIALADNKMKILFEKIVKNWKSIDDESERKILHHYSEKGRFMTIFYLMVGLLCLVGFSFLPLIPIVLDLIHPLKEKRPYIYLYRYAEFFIRNKDPYYWFFYVWDFVTAWMVIFICVAIDTMYSACIKHCLGLFAIVRHRVRAIGRSVWDGSLKGDANSTYQQMVRVIELHQQVLQFTDIMKDSYNICFLVLILIHLIGLPLCGVVIIIYMHDPINAIRGLLAFLGLAIHQFYLSWPAQELTDYSGDLFVDSYSNEWYTCAPDTKKLLRFFALRCTKPSSLTAGGIMDMNMENYRRIMKTAASYITVFASFRATESN